MSESRVTFDVEVCIVEHKDYFSATTEPFAITAYGNTAFEAETKAVESVSFLLKGVGKRGEHPIDYLNRRNVKHTLSNKKMNEGHAYITRSCKQEMVLKVPTIA